MKKRYVIAMNRRTGKRATSEEKNGLQISIAVSVPAKSHRRFDVPEAAPTASRIGRRTNHPLNTKKKYADASSIALISSGRTSTKRRNAR